MDKIDNNYITNAIDELVNMLGIKEDIPTESIRKPFNSGNIKASIENIASYLGLPISVNLAYVPSTYRREYSGNRFDTDALTTTDRAGRGREGITAQVSIPDYLPLYGTAGLKNFPIAVKISKNCLNHPESFFTIMAHELSHILLYSLRHAKKDNEIYTDLTAMILGFSNVMRVGRTVIETREHMLSTETRTTTYGYLQDKQFNFAFSRISNILKQNVHSKKVFWQGLIAYKKQLSSFKQQVSRLNKLVEYLDRHQGSKFKTEDLPRIILVHQLNYVDELRAAIRSNEEKLNRFSGWYTRLSYYSQQGPNSLSGNNKRLDTLIAELRTHLDLLKRNVKILENYVSFPDRIKWTLFGK